MGSDDSVNDHTWQDETSHSQGAPRSYKFESMNGAKDFRDNLERIMLDKGMNPAQLSLRAGLNRRAVSDILEGRAQSPKLSTALSLASALGCDVGELIGLGKRAYLVPELAELLSQYDQSAQEQLAKALAQIPQRPASKQ